MARPTGLIAKPPRKPRRNFPLFAHRGGSWMCKVDGKPVSFGGWKNDPKGEAAYLRWKEFDDARRNGREVRPVRTSPVTLREVATALLEDREAKMQRGELDAGSYADYRNALRSFAAMVGADRSPYDLTPMDFARVKSEWAKTRGPYALGRWVQLVRTMFRHAGPDRIGLMDRSLKYGEQFNKPSKKLRRRGIRAAEAEHGKRLFAPGEIGRILGGCGPTLKACVLLGLNCGFLAIDCARLTERDLNLETGMLDLVRQKTETPRRAVLWPATIRTVRAAMDARPEPKDETYAGLLFLTREGYPLVHDIVTRTESEGVKKVRRCDSVNQAMRDVLERLGIKRKWINFSTCRKTFSTAADEMGDTNAKRLVMGHAFGGMDEFYVRAMTGQRLRRLADYVWDRLLRVRADCGGADELAQSEGLGDSQSAVSAA